MYKYLKKISTKAMPHEEWLEHRRRSIGGSDAAAIIGLNPYASAYSVWAEKSGLLPPKEDNEAMRLGRDLEDYVAKRFCEVTGKRVRRENSIIINPDYPFSHANVDRILIGEDAGLEIKTTSSLNLKKFKNGGVPGYILLPVYALYGCNRRGALVPCGAYTWQRVQVVLHRARRGGNCGFDALGGGVLEACRGWHASCCRRRKIDL